MFSPLVWVLAVVELLTVALAEPEVVTCGSNVVPMATKNAASLGCRFRFDPAVVQGREEELRDLVSAKSRQLEDQQQSSSRSDHAQQYFHQLNNRASPRAREMWRLTVEPLRKAKNLAATLSQSLGLQAAMGGDVLVWLNITSPDCPATPKCDPTSLYRTVDGSCNNLLYPAVGMANTPFQRLLRPSYGDGIHEPRRAVDGHPLPNARSLSLALFPDKDVPDERRPLVVMYWGQLVAHDTSLSAFHLIDEDGAEILCCSRDGSYVIETPERRGACYAIPLPEDDPFFPAHGVRCFTMIRTLSAPSLDCKLGPADKMNGVTHFLDLSMVYGSEPSRTLELREMSGGRLKSQTSKDGRTFLPSVGDPPAECDVASSTDTCYQSGDFRVNQNYQLAALQVVLLREHNRLAKELSTLNPTWNDNRLYEEARRLLIAQYQHITYTNYLPSLLGNHFMDLYQLRPNPYDYNYHYDATLNPSTINSFNTAAFRIFHSTIQGEIRFMDQEYCPMSKERFSDGFFKPAKVQDPGLLDGMLRGLAHQPSQTLDTFFTEEVTRYLFRTNTSVGLDLETFDIERGRDHGLPCYNSFRYLCNLPVAHSFDAFLDVMSKKDVVKLASLYNHPDDVDLFVGGILERPLPGTMLGPTFHCLAGEQFYRWKYGDRFFYDNGGFPHSFTPAQLAEIRKSSLSRWLCDNGDNITQIQPDIFKSVSKSTLTADTISTSLTPVIVWSKLVGALPLSRGGVVLTAICLLINVAQFAYLPYVLVHSDWWRSQGAQLNQTVSPGCQQKRTQNQLAMMMNIVVISIMGLGSRWTSLMKLPSLFLALVGDLEQCDAVLRVPRHSYLHHLRCSMALVVSCCILCLVVTLYYLLHLVLTTDVWAILVLLLMQICTVASHTSDLQYTSLCIAIKTRFELVNSQLEYFSKNITYHTEATNRRTHVGIHLAPQHNPGGGLPSQNYKNGAFSKVSHNVVFHEDRISVGPSNIFMRSSNEKHQMYGTSIRDRKVCKNNDSFAKSKVCDRPLHFIQNLRGAHQDLCDAVTELSCIYNVHLLLSVCGCFTNALLNLYFTIFGYACGPGIESDVVQTVMSAILTIYYITRFIVINMVSDVTNSQKLRSRTLCARATARHLPADLKEELNLFFLQASSHDDGFSACGFFNLRNELISSAIAAGTTYMVIMAQFRSA